MSAIMPTLIQVFYLSAASLFILGLHKLSSPATARRGNTLAAIGMLIAILATLVDRNIDRFELIVAGLAVATVIGTVTARKVKMAAMPQLVGLFNGLGGGASALVAVAAFQRAMVSPETQALDTFVTIQLGVLIGGVTFTGSLIAFGKLQGLVKRTPVLFPLQHPLNGLLLLGFIAGSLFMMMQRPDEVLFLGLTGLALLLGLLMVIPIGGADMPVVISLLNSLSGLAASAAGFVLENNLLIIAGALVGASGFILTQIMCRAMNRSLLNVLVGGVGGAGTTPDAGQTVPTGKTVHSIDAEEAAMLLAYARSVIIVPGYGMAVAQAQHAVKELANELERRHVSVKYAIHPVAGRMPGHMNVLLAEADVPYTQLYDMDDINPEFAHTDVALVIGANDVINPAARHDQNSPIYGMPILNVDQAKHVIIIKRSLNPGFSGIENELFYHERTMMLFGNARERVADLTREVKEL